MKHNPLSTVLSFHINRFFAFEARNLIFLLLLLFISAGVYSQSAENEPTGANGTSRQDGQIASGFPVDIISFSTNLNKDKVSVLWSVASESYLSHYVIQRSYDDTRYEDIATIFGKGPDQKISYKYVDTIKGKNKGIVYYRLKAVDNSNKNKYSSISIVRLAENKMSSILAFPNPFHNEIFITLPSKWQDKPVRLQVFNNSGQKVSEHNIGTAGQTETLLLGGLSRGTYIVRAVNGNESYQQMIIKD